MHQDVSELKTILHQSPQMTLNLEVTSHWWPPNRVQGQDLTASGEWIYDDLEWGTCVDATIVETRTSAAHPQERQATNHWWCTTHHTSQCTPQHALPNGCLIVERLNDHTVFGFTLCFHCKQTHHFIIVQIFVNFFPHYHFNWNCIDNTISIQKHPQTANCKKCQNLLQLEECGL